MAVKDSHNSTGIRILFSTLVCLLSCLTAVSGFSGSYRVSVYQPRMTRNLSSRVSREGALAHMSRHLAKYELAAEKAARWKAQILVYPEYGLYADIDDFTRDTMYTFLEPIPNPHIKFPWTPCDINHHTDDIAIQKKLSCIAKRNKLYIVANVGERRSCKKDRDYSCPVDGRYQFNVNVVYAPNGTLISLYRKKHLFYEPYFNEPAVAQHAIFETPFGRFASIICFDIYFRDTFLDLIQSKAVTNIILPNMWFNIPPLFLSVPYHASLAWATNINLISANIAVDEPKKTKTVRTGGGGFYSGSTGDFYYSHSPGLMTATLTTKASDAPRFSVIPKRATPCYGNQTITLYSVEGVEFKSVQVVYKSGCIGVCHEKFCCGLEYEYESHPKSLVTYWLGASNFYEFQACAVCTLILDKMSCENIPADKSVQFSRFKRIRMFANNFSTPYVFPQAVEMSGSNYWVMNPKFYYYNGEIKLRRTAPLHSVVLFGRIFFPPHVFGSK